MSVIPATVLAPSASDPSILPQTKPPLKPGTPIFGADQRGEALGVLTRKSVLIRANDAWRELPVAEVVEIDQHLRITGAYAFVAVDGGEFPVGGLRSVELRTGRVAFEMSGSVTALAALPNESCVVAAGWSYLASRGELLRVCRYASEVESGITLLAGLPERVSDIMILSANAVLFASSSGLTQWTRAGASAVHEIDAREVCGLQLTRYQNGSRVVSLATPGWHSAAIVDEGDRP